SGWRRGCSRRGGGWRGTDRATGGWLSPVPADSGDGAESGAGRVRCRPSRAGRGRGRVRRGQLNTLRGEVRVVVRQHRIPASTVQKPQCEVLACSVLLRAKPQGPGRVAAGAGRRGAAGVGGAGPPGPVARGLRGPGGAAPPGSVARATRGP